MSDIIKISKCTLLGHFVGHFRYRYWHYTLLGIWWWNKWAWRGIWNMQCVQRSEGIYVSLGALIDPYYHCSRIVTLQSVRHRAFCSCVVIVVLIVQMFSTLYLAICCTWITLLKTRITSMIKHNHLRYIVDHHYQSMITQQAQSKLMDHKTIISRTR